MSMPKITRAEQLQIGLDEGDVAACLTLFDAATDDERREAAKLAIATYKRFRKPNADGNLTAQHVEAARIALLSACTLSELSKLGWQAVPKGQHALQILSTRRPPWLSEYAEWLIGENARHWPLVRALVRRSLCQRPQHENYVFGMMLTLNGFFTYDLIDPNSKSIVANLRQDPELLQEDVWRLFQFEGQGELTLAGHDKYLGGKNVDHCWSHALKELSRTGELSRDRLLDESLQALNRGFSQFRVAWFSQFHELLEPTLTERRERQDKYLQLLASPIPPTVTFALDALDIIDDEQPIAAGTMIETLRPVVLSKNKGTAKRAVQWLDRLACREDDCKSEAVGVAIQALAHEATDVQKAAIDMLTKHGCSDDALLREQLQPLVASVAASLRKRLDAWLAAAATDSKPTKQRKPVERAGSGLAALQEQIAAIPSKWIGLAGIPPLMKGAQAGRIEIKALEFEPLDVPRLDPAATLAPVRDLDEWIDVCAHFLETPEEIDEGERVLEGLSRMGDQSPEEDDLARRLGPLRKRIEKIYSGYCGPFLGLRLRDDVCGVVRAWIAGRAVIAEAKGQGRNKEWHFPDKDRPVWLGTEDAPALWALSQRSCELAERVAQRQARPLLSAATHRGGWVDPRVFADRLLAWDKLGERPPHHDAILGLLRLAPDNRAAALTRLTKLRGELADAARYALGGEKPEIGKTAALWVAAARARDPWRDDPLIEKRFPNQGPGGGTAARYRWEFRPESFTYGGKRISFARYHVQVEPEMPKDVEKDLPSILMNRVLKHFDAGDVSHVRWHGSLWPAGREAHFVRGTWLLANNIDWSEAEWGNKTYLEPLLDADEPLGELGRTALCLGLSAKEPGEHTLAADVLAAAISDGRVDGQCLAPTLAIFLTTAGIKVGRWSKVFGVVARISPLHAHVVRQTLENTLALAGRSLAEPPKDIHYLLELLLELLAESGTALSNAAARDSLGQFTGSGKAGKAAKALLAVQPESDGSSVREIAQQALQGRIDRARRWSERVQS